MSSESDDEPTIVFLHGLGRGHRSLSRLRAHVAKHGYRTWSRTYPSRRRPLPELADTVADWIKQDVGDGPIIGVTHSMGGIVARHIGERLDWRGMIMLAPPNSGSRVARALAHVPAYRWYFGPAALELADATQWPAPPCPTAVIAGTRGPSLSNLPSWVVGSLKVFDRGEPSDGTVGVDETHIDGMVSFAKVHASHTWLMNHPRTRELVLEFLRGKKFGDE